MESWNKLSMCRLCLCENKCFINVFELNDWQGYVAAEVIADLLQLQVSETDGYPHVVCSKCMVKLTDFKLFKECCQRSKVKYDNMYVSSKSLEEHQSGTLVFVTVKSEPIFSSDDKDNISKEVGRDTECCDQDPLGEISSQVEEFELQESDSFSEAVVGISTNAKEMSDDFESEITIKEEPLPVQDTDTFTHPHYLQRSEHVGPHRLSEGACGTGSCSRNTSTDDEPTSERSKNISTSGTMERSEGQSNSPREMCVDALFQRNVGIGREGWREGGEAGGELRRGTPQMRNEVVRLLETNLSCREVARRMGVAPSTVARIKKKWETEHSVKQRKGQGRPRSTTTDEDVRLLEYIKENPFASSTQARIESNIRASMRTVSRRILAADLQSRRTAIKEILTPAHCAARLEFANVHLRKGEEFWRRVIFSDEKIFSSASSGPVLVYQPQNTRFDPRYIHEQARSGRFLVHIWAWMSADGPGVCWRVDGALNGEKYVQILDNVMLPSVTSLFADDFIYQQDNTRLHSCVMARKWFEDKQITQLVWPARSRDLKPIEDIWACMARDITNKKVRAQNADQLWQQIEEEWESISVGLCRSIVNSMPKRLELVVQNRGGWNDC